MPVYNNYKSKEHGVSFSYTTYNMSDLINLKLFPVNGIANIFDLFPETQNAYERRRLCDKKAKTYIRRFLELMLGDIINNNAMFVLPEQNLGHIAMYAIDSDSYEAVFNGAKSPCIMIFQKKQLTNKHYYFYLNSKFWWYVCCNLYRGHKYPTTWRKTQA